MTLAEEKKLNIQLQKWQARQLQAVKRNYIDYAYEKMTEIDRSVWEIVARAKSYKDVNWLVWRNAEKVIDKYYKLAARGEANEKI